MGLRDQLQRDIWSRSVWDYRDLHAPATRGASRGSRLTILNSSSRTPQTKTIAPWPSASSTTASSIPTARISTPTDSERILARFPELVRTHVYRANHHLHGSLSEEHLIKADPDAGGDLGSGGGLRADRLHPRLRRAAVRIKEAARPPAGCLPDAGTGQRGDLRQRRAGLGLRHLRARTSSSPGCTPEPRPRTDASSSEEQGGEHHDQRQQAMSSSLERAGTALLAPLLLTGVRRRSGIVVGVVGAESLDSDTPCIRDRGATRVRGGW